MPFSFRTTYTELPGRLFSRVAPTPVPAPTLLAIDDALAERLGVTAEELSAPEGVAILAGNRVPEGSDPIALAYAGHQFGSFVPQLGDGRALLLGEVVGRDGRRYDVQLKGSGPTPYSRGGDGRAAVGPVLREFLVSEAMAALGVPTTRSLAAVATGAPVFRETALPGAVLTRVAASHLRIGTFEYVAAREDLVTLQKLTDYALARHYPEIDTDNPGLALLQAVADQQATLVARWMALGFVHGVMNTDNMSISGETIDYGPCAFLDAFDPARTFSSIDRRGRYAFGNQPNIAMWNLARLAEAVLPLVSDDRDRAATLLTERLETFPHRFEHAFTDEMRGKLGLLTPREGDLDLAHALLEEMGAGRVDYTLCFRRLHDVAAGSDQAVLLEMFDEREAMLAWLERWRRRIDEDDSAPAARVARMRTSNPAFIPRNHRVEEMIAAAQAGDLQPLARMRTVLARPYDDQPEAADLAEPPGEAQWSYKTFCGT
jgi:uncharacterized protein YdiU (UPF0061 family)